MPLSRDGVACSVIFFFSTRGKVKVKFKINFLKMC
jgi:hypothetical protein